jgi:hypothetical protein
MRYCIDIPDALGFNTISFMLDTKVEVVPQKGATVRIECPQGKGDGIVISTHVYINNDGLNTEVVHMANVMMSNWKELK